MEKKKTLFTMKVEETDKGITITCEGDTCKDFIERMKKGEIKCGPYFGCCIPVKKEKESD